MWGETWSGCVKGGKGWVVPKGKAAAVGTEPLGPAQAEVGNEPWHRECQPCPVGAGQEQRGQIPAQGEGGAGFLKAAPAVTTESALPTAVPGSILHYLPTCKGLKLGVLNSFLHCCGHLM